MLDTATQRDVLADLVEEFALLRAAFAARVTVPEPLFLCEDAAVTGAPFFVMRRVWITIRLLMQMGAALCGLAMRAAMCRFREILN